MMRVLDCDFCDRLGGLHPGRPWYDFRILDSDDTFVVVVALGALAPGHIMIVTQDHHDSMAELPAEGIHRLETVASEWAARLRRRWGKAFLFEHGGRTRGGACIFHAHLHLLPLARPPIASAGRLLRRISDLPVVTQGRPYLLLSDGVDMRVDTNPESGPRRSMRRVIADFLGRPDEWDYLVFPNLDNVRLTVQGLGSKVCGASDA
jgi:diadenosine tetraphosphate (Ap4A) HIT family hydrolase